MEVCEHCGGNKSEPGSKPSTCSNCGGTGEIRRGQKSIFGQFVQVAPCSGCRGAGKVISNPCSKCFGSGTKKKKGGVEKNCSTKNRGTIDSWFSCGEYDFSKSRRWW